MENNIKDYINGKYPKEQFDKYIKTIIKTRTIPSYILNRYSDIFKIYLIDLLKKNNIEYFFNQPFIDQIDLELLNKLFKNYNNESYGLYESNIIYIFEHINKFYDQIKNFIESLNYFKIISNNDFERYPNTFEIMYKSNIIDNVLYNNIIYTLIVNYHYNTLNDYNNDNLENYIKTIYNKCKNDGYINLVIFINIFIILKLDLNELDYHLKKYSHQNFLYKEILNLLSFNNNSLNLIICKKKYFRKLLFYILNKKYFTDINLIQFFNRLAEINYLKLINKIIFNYKVNIIKYDNANLSVKYYLLQFGINLFNDDDNDILYNYLLLKSSSILNKPPSILNKQVKNLIEI